MYNIYTYHHTIKELFTEDGFITLKCIASFEKFDNIKGFWSTVHGELNYKEISKENDLVFYEVKLPHNSDNKKIEKFYALLNDGKKERVWKPDPALKKESLPSKYYFDNRYLNFTYRLEPIKPIVMYTPVLKKISSIDNNTLLIEGYIFLPLEASYDINKFKMRFIKFREEEINYSFRLSLKIPKDGTIFNRFSSRDYEIFNDVSVIEFNAKVPLLQMANDHSFFNFYITYEERDRLLQNYYASMTKKEKIFTYIKDKKGNLSIFNFYYDDITRVWRLDIYNMTQDEYSKLKKLKRQKERDPKIWLIGEYSRYARDNGMHFYNYMVKHYKEIECYYVIEKYSKDLENLDPQRIIEYGSYKHFEIASKAKVLVFTHIPKYLVPKINSITEYKKKYQNYYKMFLQHGVTGPTTSAKMHHKSLRNYNLFNVCSKFEKNIITNNLGYSGNEVVINGFPRWDRLYNEQKFTPTILIMPTWRNDLGNVDDNLFIESDYYKFWNSLLNNKEFIEFIKINNIRVDFFIHVVLNRFVKHFHVNHDYIRFQNGEHIQDLLLNCGMLVTDYSSVSFDVLFQNKPVVYAPFDFEHMIALRGGGEQYIDYEKDLPGPICKTTESVISSIFEIVSNGWKIDEKYADRKLKWFKYIDANNSERVYKSISKGLYNKTHKIKSLINSLRLFIK